MEGHTIGIQEIRKLPNILYGNPYIKHRFRSVSVDGKTSK
jgi:hypothetical protein